MRWLLALLLLSSSAYAADPKYCRAYARGALTMAVGKMSQKERTKLTFPKMLDALSRMNFTCGNLTEDFTESDAVWLVDIIDQLKQDSAAVSPPDAGPPMRPQQGPAAGPPKNAPTAAPPTKKNPAAFCAAAHRKVVFKGKSWRCTG